ncbi:hypothetical protein L9F63_025559, partial [Diploptera punctata]
MAAVKILKLHLKETFIPVILVISQKLELRKMFPFHTQKQAMKSDMLITYHPYADWTILTTVPYSLRQKR